MTAADRDLYSGLIRLHVLHHASEEPIYGQGMIDELRRHGYHIGPGTLYPILHTLDEKGYLVARQVAAGKSRRKVYRLTTKGRRAFLDARERVRELFGELFEEGTRKSK